ncbi:cell wall-active antibiotics response protein LiaF [Halalkalibacter akibai]|uniref:Transporter LiaF n=1 Tax=Halalkalibacter akibai (strain ATCC 43226 / DSM 21942 / CIP 109018 / JCM 9157 / 1139) TaxID=1236973 RepID=W4QVM8_HALA3|nr:cell wall-active antibiotics response protein LiaF [Halalkalibacter akibai]GAE35688.1 transporter LiaF [Halalkalibacter akibai JCM 9157]
MKKQTIFGIIVVIIGLNILFNSMNLSTGTFIAPLIFLLLGFFFYKRKHTFISIIFFIISASILFDQILGFNFIPLLIGILALYYGLRLVRSPSKKETRRVRTKKAEDVTKKEVVEEEIPIQNDIKEERVVFAPTMRRSFIGDIHYIGEAFELNDLTIWNGIGDVRLDLSKAIIPEGETVIIVQCMIGQIDFYVPEDLTISIQASTIIGEVSLFHEKHEGINQQLSIATKNYKQASRRVKLILSTVIGEVKVRVI